jgi:hypothetical protein
MAGLLKPIKVLLKFTLEIFISFNGPEKVMNKAVYTIFHCRVRSTMKT